MREEEKTMTRAGIRIWVTAATMVLTAAACVGQQASKKLTNQDVTEMLSLGLSDDVVVDKIHAAATDFDTSVDGLKALKAAKVSDTIIRAMINPHPASATNTGSTADEKQPPKGDPNDPNSPHDPGIYIYAKTRNGLSLVMLEPTVYSQGKSGGVFKSAMTYGIAKVKWKAVVQGPTANVKSSDSNMAFYFYFEEASAGLSHASFGGTTTPNEFTLLKFEEKKDSRETVVMSANAFGASSGTDEKANIHFSFTKLRPGVYKVTPNSPLQQGEYCFLSSAGVGTYGAGSAGASRLFDFQVTAAE
jgi:hypothetical protein